VRWTKEVAAEEAEGVQGSREGVGDHEIHRWKSGLRRRNGGSGRTYRKRAGCFRVWRDCVVVSTGDCVLCRLVGVGDCGTGGASRKAPGMHISSVFTGTGTVPRMLIAYETLQRMVT